MNGSSYPGVPGDPALGEGPARECLEGQVRSGGVLS